MCQKSVRFRKSKEKGLAANRRKSLCSKWPRRDLNPHERLSPRDFKFGPADFRKSLLSSCLRLLLLSLLELMNAIPFAAFAHFRSSCG